MKAWIEVLAGLAMVAAWVAVSAAADRATSLPEAAGAVAIVQPSAWVQAPPAAAKAASSGGRAERAG